MRPLPTSQDVAGGGGGTFFCADQEPSWCLGFSLNRKALKETLPSCGGFRNTRCVGSIHESEVRGPSQSNPGLFGQGTISLPEMGADLLALVKQGSGIAVLSATRCLFLRCRQANSHSGRILAFSLDPVSQLLLTAGALSESKRRLPYWFIRCCSLLWVVWMKSWFVRNPGSCGS